MTAPGISLAELATAAARPAATEAPAVAADWNGTLGKVDLAKPSDYTGDFGKLITVRDNLSLADTLEYYMWLCQDKPKVDTPVTQDHLDRFIPFAREIIARYRIYKIFHHAGKAPTFRKSDTLDVGFCPVVAKKNREVREIVAMLTTEGAMEDEIAKVGRNILYSFPANGIHREQHDLHNWFTEEMKNPRSPTSKALGVAGRNKEEFRVFMEGRGHDGNHHLPDEMLDAYSKVICQVDTDLEIPAGTSIMYGGRDIAGMKVYKIFDLGESVKGRYPAGILGKAAIIIGLSMFQAMISHLATRVKIVGIKPILINVTRLTERVKDASFPHKVLLRLGTTLGPQFAVTYGFLLHSNILEEEDYKAFSNHASRYPAEMASGKSLASALKRAAPHREAITGAIVTALTSMAESLTTAAAIDTGAGGGAAVAPVLTNLEKVKLDDIVAEVGKVDSTPSGATMFYDAEP
jgi:hypothetical protein